MYPIHRKNLLKKIKTCSGKWSELPSDRNQSGGGRVDLDFKTVYRELAGIDSVIQAGGRCNREGKEKPEESQTVVFTLEESEDIHIPGQLKLPITVAGQIARKYEDISSLEAIHEYFERLYHFRETVWTPKILSISLSRPHARCCFRLPQWRSNFT